MRKINEELTSRIRAIIRRRKGFSEKNMFGGIGFFINDHMCAGAWKGSLIVRLDREDHDEIQSEPHVGPMDITGKVMRGWAMISPAGIEADEDLKTWVRRAADFAGSLPIK